MACRKTMRIKDVRQGLHTLVHTQGLDGLLHLYQPLEKRSRALLLCLLFAETEWVCLVNAWLRPIRKQRHGLPKNNAHKGREAGATYAGAYTGAGRVAASISAPRKTEPCPAAVPIIRRDRMGMFGKRLAAAYQEAASWPAEKQCA